MSNTRRIACDCTRSRPFYTFSIPFLRTPRMRYAKVWAIPKTRSRASPPISNSRNPWIHPGPWKAFVKLMIDVLLVVRTEGGKTGLSMVIYYFSKSWTSCNLGRRESIWKPNSYCYLGTRGRDGFNQFITNICTDFLLILTEDVQEPWYFSIGYQRKFSCLCSRESVGQFLSQAIVNLRKLGLPLVLTYSPRKSAVMLRDWRWSRTQCCGEKERHVSYASLFLYGSAGHRVCQSQLSHQPQEHFTYDDAVCSPLSNRPIIGLEDARESGRSSTQCSIINYRIWISWIPALFGPFESHSFLLNSHQTPQGFLWRIVQYISKKVERNARPICIHSPSNHAW